MSNGLVQLENSLLNARAGLYAERRKLLEQIADIKEGLRICHIHLGRAYEVRLNAEAVGDTLRSWFRLVKKEIN